MIKEKIAIELGRRREGVGIEVVVGIRGGGEGERGDRDGVTSRD